MAGVWYGGRMSRPAFADAFAHHVWATLRLVDACLALSAEQLRTTVPGTYGSILETMRHLVVGDSSYLIAMTGKRSPLVDEDQMDLPGLRIAMERHGVAWSRLLARALDPDEIFHERGDDGFERDAPMAIGLAQALQHGNDHRSQICTVLTTLGGDPPSIDVWDFGLQAGRVVERLPGVTR